MSMELMVKAMKAKVGNPLRKLVLIKLADNASDSGECWPSYQHIADQCEISKSTVRKHIKDLADNGLLIITNRKGPKGNSSNIYTLTLCRQKAPLIKSGVRSDSSEGVPSESIGMPSESTGGMPSDGTGISHSFEPVNEPIKTKAKKINHTADDLKLSEWIFSRVQIIVPSIKKQNLNTWSNTIRLMREIDGLTHKEITNQFDWANRDPFWSTNILSPEKLRKQWDSITARRIPHGRHASSVQQNNRHENKLFDTPRGNLDALMQRANAT